MGNSFDKTICKLLTSFIYAKANLSFELLLYLYHKSRSNIYLYLECTLFVALSPWNIKVSDQELDKIYFKEGVQFEGYVFYLQYQNI